MRKHLLYITGLVILTIGCSHPKINNGESSSSINNEIVAENADYQVSLQDEGIADRIEGMTLKKVSLWIYNKKTNQEKRFLLSHPEADCSWFSMEHAVNVPLDSIPTISKVTILSWEGEPLKLLVEGCPDYRNVESFIINEGSDSAICLPTNRGLIGISEENGLLIMQSYAYYEEGGRYNIIEAFNTEGKRISSMAAKTNNEGHENN